MISWERVMSQKQCPAKDRQPIDILMVSIKLPKLPKLGDTEQMDGDMVSKFLQRRGPAFCHPSL